MNSYSSSCTVRFTVLANRLINLLLLKCSMIKTLLKRLNYIKRLKVLGKILFKLAVTELASGLNKRFKGSTKMTLLFEEI